MPNLEWEDFSACRGRRDLNFFGKLTNKISELCRSCPVFENCRSYAIANEAYGIWAGLTEERRYEERRALGLPEPRFAPDFARKTASKKELKPIKHDTETGYQTHLRRRDPFLYENGTPCKCQEAHRITIRNYRAKKEVS